MAGPDRTLDLRLGGPKNAQFRLDVFNALNTIVIDGRQNQLQLSSPTDLTIRNPQYLADGTLNPARIRPQDAGFGAATSPSRCGRSRLKSGSSSKNEPKLPIWTGRRRAALPRPADFRRIQNVSQVDNDVYSQIRYK
jgi:hypothetical protein